MQRIAKILKWCRKWSQSAKFNKINVQFKLLIIGLITF